MKKNAEWTEVRTHERRSTRPIIGSLFRPYVFHLKLAIIFFALLKIRPHFFRPTVIQSPKSDNYKEIVKMGKTATL